MKARIVSRSGITKTSKDLKPCLAKNEGFTKSYSESDDVIGYRAENVLVLCNEISMLREDRATARRDILTAIKWLKLINAELET